MILSQTSECYGMTVGFFGIVLVVSSPIEAEGLFHRLPPDGAWVRFETPYLYRGGDTKLSGQGTVTMASVGTIFERSEECGWIEFKMRLIDEDGTEHLLIRKLLLPVGFLKAGGNPTLRVIRGWAKFDSEEVEPAVPVHGRWPVFLAGPLQGQAVLEGQVVESKLGSLRCAGVAGWIRFRERGMTTNRLNGSPRGGRRRGCDLLPEFK